MTKRKICIVTGTRAEWGLLSRIAALLRDSSDVELQIIACNMHLSPEYGNTYREIEQGGFKIDYRVEMLLSGDSPTTTAKSVGIGVIGFAEAYSLLKPDMLLILGDRYEMLAAASSALFFKIPIAHLHGGEITEGAYDDSIRHAITKLSHLHFTSTESYRERVIQLGEDPARVFNVGAIGIDNIRQLTLMDKESLEQSIGGFKVDRKTLLVTFHPATLDEGSPSEQMDNLLEALELHIEREPDTKVIFTMPNSDTNGRIIAEKIKSWVEKNSERAIWFNSLGLIRYLSTLQYIGAVVGNSSSGIIEVPSFGIPTINIGSRQKGRIYPQSVIHCGVSREEIDKQLSDLSPFSLSTIVNDYEKPDTAQEIFDIITNHPLEGLIIKKFYDRL